MISKVKFSILAVVVILAIGIFILSNNNPKNQITNEEDQETIASVNGQSITAADIARTQKAALLTGKVEITEAQALERTIGERLMLQEAERLELTLTTPEAEDHLSKYLTISGKTLDNVKEALSESEENYAAEMEVYRQQVTINRLLTEKTPLPEITDEEVQEYYELNKDKMFPAEGLVASYDQIAPQLKQAIAQQRRQEEITTFVNSLRENAEIVYLNQAEN